MSKVSDEIRKNFGEADRARDKGLTTPKDITRYDDLSYGKDPVWNILDVYRPKKAKGKLPVIVIVHGGGWVYGDKGVYQFYGMSLAQRGFAVVNYTYRLAPEHKFPAPIEDACSVFRWIFENAEKYGLDTANLFAVGDSAGAHLLTLFSALVTNPEFKKNLKAEYPKGKFTLPKGLRLNAVALNCGKYDLGAERPMDPLIKELMEKGSGKAKMALINAAKQVGDAFPPSFVMTCPGDFLRTQGACITEVLNEHSIPFCYRYYGNKKNPLFHVFHCNIRLPEATKCNDDETAFFREYIR